MKSIVASETPLKDNQSVNIKIGQGPSDGGGTSGHGVGMYTTPKNFQKLGMKESTNLRLQSSHSTKFMMSPNKGYSEVSSPSNT